MRLILQLMLGLGASVATCRSGEAAWERFQQEPFDILLLDVRMPGLDGIGLTSLVRQKTGGEKSWPWIIAVTAQAQAEDRTICLDAGMNEYLRKPIEKDLLVAALRTAIESTTAKRPPHRA